MVLKTGSTAIAHVKGSRGLAYDTTAYFARDQVVFISEIAVSALGQSLTPGQETEVLVPVSGLRANADVKRIRATVRVFEDAPPTPQPGTLHVTEGDGPERTFLVSAEAPPGLSNVSVRLDPGEIFWTHSGLLAPGDHTIPVDFAEQVNAYLDHTAHSEETVMLKFMVKSDTPGRIVVRFDTVEFTLLQTQTWPNELDGTLRTDRNLTLDFHSEERLPLSAIAPLNGRPPALVRISLDLSGQLGPERVLETTGGPVEGEFCTISSEYALARGFILDPVTMRGGIVQCTGFSVYLRQAAEAEIYAEVQVDAAPATTGAGNGNQPTPGLTTPASGAPLTKANLVIAPPPEAQGQSSERWVYVRFENPAELQVGLPYWLVIKGVRGEAYLGLRPADESAAGRGVREERLRINRGGRLWKGLQRGVEDRIRARLSLVYTPGPDNGLAAVEVHVETAEYGAGVFSAPVDPGPQPESISIGLSGAAPPHGAVLIVRSNAAGACAIANVIQEYMPGGSRP
jgi:hypothetical protein